MSKYIYFPVYERIEKEILELSSAIHFVDGHEKVYSIYIADLIFRCSVELESIAKDIYRNETEKEPSSPGTCFKWMEEHWKISKKAIFIDSPHFHFKEIFKPILCPFEYENDTEDDYYSIYNAIKHERVKNLSKANIYTLIRVLGALYILNLYYYNEKVYLKDDKYGETIDRMKYSKIFSYYVAPCEDIMLLDSQKSINPENCIYKIVRKESEYAFKITYRDKFDEIQSVNMVEVNEVFQNYAKVHLDKIISINNFINMLAKIHNDSPDNTKELILNPERKIKEILSVQSVKMKSSYWANLNK